LGFCLVEKDASIIPRPEVRQYGLFGQRAGCAWRQTGHGRLRMGDLETIKERLLGERIGPSLFYLDHAF